MNAFHSPLGGKAPETGDAQRGLPSSDEHIKPGTEESIQNEYSSTLGGFDTEPVGGIITEDILKALVGDFCNSNGTGGAHMMEDSNMNRSPDDVPKMGSTSSSLGTSFQTYGPEIGDIDRLRTRGDALFDQFRRSGAVEDINGVVDCRREALHRTPGSHPARPGLLDSLGIAYQVRFGRLGELLDLSKAVECGAQAVSLAPEGHADKPGFLSNLGTSCLSRFEVLGELADLDQAITCGSQAASLIPNDHAHKPNILDNLGNSYRIRFERVGWPVDLNKAVECGLQAVLLALDSSLDNPGLLSNLGISYRARFECLGELGDLNKAIECGDYAVSLMPNDHPDKLKVLNNLGMSYQSRFERAGEVVDLNKAIECKDQAVSLTPDNHPDKPTLLSNLGNSCLIRFRCLGEEGDLNKAIHCGAQAVSLTPDGCVDKPSRLNNLGSSYRVRFEYLGGLADLNKAIEYNALAVSLTPDDHIVKSGRLSNLGASYGTRFERLGELADLSKAIEYTIQAVSLTPDTHTIKPGRLTNLGNSYLTRFGRLGELVDLDKAIECGAQAVSLTPPGHIDRPGRVGNLGVSYAARFAHLGDLVDLNKSIEHGAQAVSLTPDDHSAKPSRLHNLGISYRTRFKQIGELEDLNKAIECGTRAALFIPDGHADRPCFLSSLGDSYSTRFSHLREPPDLKCAITHLQNAAKSLTGPPSIRFDACRSWAKLSSHPTSMSSPYSAYQLAMDLLPQLIWIGTTLDRRYALIRDVSDFATEAASYAISISNHELALEWLEAGRSIVWSQIAQLRTPFDQLSIHDTNLANQLKEVSRKLEHASSRSSSIPSPERSVDSLDEEASCHMQLAFDWDVLLSEARSLPGFEHFLEPPKSGELICAARLHPVAVINVHDSRCDALIIQPNSSTVAHVPLTELSGRSTITARKHLVSQVRQRKIGRLHQVGSLEGSLKDLWSSVLMPVLDFLGYTHKLPIDDLPHLTWCTTGLLSFLPLHAAGLYDGSHHNALDLVVSSYTPTLSVLLTQQSIAPSTNWGILAVGQEHTPGLDPLPGTKDELTIIGKRAQGCCYLQLEGEEATVDMVLEAMDQFSWVHMACHGSQDTTDPTQSAFHLHDGKLTLAMITKRSFTNKGLAFLSACQTATGAQELPEEAVHLAAGMLMAGFPSVIGTMWSISDEDGPKVAKRVYASLLKEGRMDHKDAARILHKAVAELRAEVGEACFERWAPFIHIGS